MRKRESEREREAKSETTVRIVVTAACRSMTNLSYSTGIVVGIRGARCEKARRSASRAAGRSEPTTKTDVGSGQPSEHRVDGHGLDCMLQDIFLFSCSEQDKGKLANVNEAMPESGAQKMCPHETRPVVQKSFSCVSIDKNITGASRAAAYGTRAVSKVEWIKRKLPCFRIWSVGKDHHLHLRLRSSIPPKSLGESTRIITALVSVFTASRNVSSTSTVR